MSATVITFPRDNARDDFLRDFSELASFPDTVPVPPFDPLGQNRQFSAELNVICRKAAQLHRDTANVLERALLLADVVHQESPSRFPSTEDGENEWERIHMNSWEPPVNGGDAA